MDKDLLFKPRLPEDDVELDGVGTVRVRGLTAGEAVMIAEVKGLDAKNRKTLALGVVDPELTEADAGRWVKAAPAGEIEKVSKRIAQLSGMFDAAPKAAYAQFEDSEGAEFRVLPGAETRDDGGPAALGDAG